MSSITASFKKSYWNFMICYFYTQYFHSAQDVVQAFYNPLYKSPKCQLVCRKANWIAWLSSVNSDYICFTFFLYGSQRSKQNPQFESLSNLNKQKRITIKQIQLQRLFSSGSGYQKMCNAANTLEGSNIEMTGIYVIKRYIFYPSQT